MQQQSLFPAKNSVKELEQEALMQLPITDANQLLTLLRTQQNTIISEIEREGVSRARTN